MEMVMIDNNLAYSSPATGNWPPATRLEQFFSKSVTTFSY
jgi:hypothetical protein